MKNHGSVNNKVEICTAEAGDAFPEGRVLLVASSNCIELTKEEGLVLSCVLTCIRFGVVIDMTHALWIPWIPRNKEYV